MKIEIPMSCRRLVQTEPQLNIIKKKFGKAVLNCACFRVNLVVLQSIQNFLQKSVHPNIEMKRPVILRLLSKTHSRLFGSN